MPDYLRDTYRALAIALGALLLFGALAALFPAYRLVIVTLGAVVVTGGAMWFLLQLYPM
jgi:hypothetical protein